MGTRSVKRWAGLLTMISGALLAQVPDAVLAPHGIAGDIYGVVTFSGSNFVGQQVIHHCVSVCTYRLPGITIRAVSLRIESGRWLFCSEANLRGECAELGQGDYADTKALFPQALYNEVVSLRRLSDDAGAAPRPAMPASEATTKH